MLISTGIPTKEDLQGVTPPAQRRAKGPVAMAECFQKIPCNPCAASCPVKAIHIGEDINECPTIDFDLCTGCGTCAARCPQQALSVQNGRCVCAHSRCLLCGYCSSACPMWAIKVV